MTEPAKKSLGWEDVAKAAVLIAVVGALAIFGVFIYAPKNVDYYYLSHSGAGNTATCVYAHWTWHIDETAFCTDDVGKAMEYATKANQDLRAR